jgi:hypothetical protein
VLQNRSRIVANPCKQWRINTMKIIMNACIVLYNTIIGDENNEENLGPLIQMERFVKLRRILPFESIVVRI